MTTANEDGAQSLRRMLGEHGLIRAMAAHSPLSAMLVEEAGFDAIWASGFELSALFGLPDASLVTMTEHLGMVRAMGGRCGLPIVADIDTGFGNAINVLHTVREYERAGAAAVVLEDKQFPKVTSLLDGARQELVRIEEFQGKIEAALHARQRGELVVVARTEALIAGLGQQEALRRGHAYADAGADMILVHSKQKTPIEIEEFVREWERPVPLVIVPTAYPELEEARIRQMAKIGMVIYGNHAIRASIRGMRAAFAEIARTGNASTVRSIIAEVEDVFELQDMNGVNVNEARYVR